MSAIRPAYINGYADAVAAGNALLCLPLELRQDIFAFAALAFIREKPEHGHCEATNILQGRQCEWLPPMCHVNDAFFVESLPMFLRHTSIVVRGSYSAYNLRFFLQATKTFANIYELRFTMTEAFAPLSAGAGLLRDCINLRTVWLTFHFDDFDFNFPRDAAPAVPALPAAPAANPGIISARSIGNVDRKAFAEAYPFRQLLSLKHIESITFFVVSDPALPEGSTDLWGIAGWLHRKFLRRGLAVWIGCKSGPAKLLDEEAMIEERHFMLRAQSHFWQREAVNRL